MAKIVFSEDHPCYGKSCNECETCIFDEPIPSHEDKLNIFPRCNECGYLIKMYTGHGSLCFNAACGKHMIITDNAERGRIIQRNVYGKETPVYQPDWCPKLLEKGQKPVLALPAKVSNSIAYDDYIEKRNKMMELPSVMNWKDIKDGDICVVPKILRHKRQILLVKEASEYVLKCIELKEDLTPTSTYVNIYSNDIFVKFIVKYHKF